MELVYVWIEKFKNVKNIGIHLTNRIRCDYTSKTGNLTIKKGKLPLADNFFSENIKISSIVGKNGCGKSNILEMIASDDLAMFRGKFLRIYYHEENVYIDPSKGLDCFIADCDFLYEVKSNVAKNILYSLDILKFEPTASYSQYFSLRYADLNILTQKLTNHPAHFTVSRVLEVVFQKIIKLSRFEHSQLKRLQFETIILRVHDIDIAKAILTGGTKDEVNKVLTAKNKNYINFDRTDDLVYCEFKKLLRDMFGNKDSDFLEQSLDVFYDRHYSTEDDRTIFNILMATNLFDFDFQGSDGRRFTDFSSGERVLLIQNYCLVDAVISSNEKDLLILLDEPDLTLHPDWQKDYVRKLISLFSNFKEKRFHFIIATHSPFILSDIPNTNIAYLDVSKDDGACKLATGLKAFKNTFGANIHTLLSDSFFMTDGLIGTFAEQKINEVIRFIVKNDTCKNVKNFEEAESVVELIGEPIIKNKLQEMIESKRSFKT